MFSQKKLGKSNINISSIGFGGAPIGDLFENLDDSLCQEILKESYKKGLNFYDTSPFYGFGLSEVRIGKFLKSIKKIYVLDNGHIVESGCHESLMKAKRHYYNLYNSKCFY